MSSAFERLQKVAQQKKENEKPNLELVPNNKSKMGNQPNIPNIPNQDNQPNILNQPKLLNQPNQHRNQEQQKSRKAISPERDFTKVPNSVARDAVPERLFKGMSKNTYDALYLRTRGAVNPVREIRATKSDLLRWTGISDVTLDKHLKHLRSVGLVKWQFIIGSHEGNIYEIFIPEEIEITNLTNPNQPNLPKKVGGEIPNFLGGVGGVENYENKAFNSPSKTSLKTNTIDDESPLAKVLKMLNEAAKRATGKDLTAKDFEALKDIVEIIISETDLARTRTHSVSVYLKLAAENLRRRLYAKQTGAKTTKKPEERNWTEVGKNQTADEYDEQGNYIPKPLDEKGRNEALQILRDYQSWDAPIKDSKRFYTEEDWNWLMNNLPKKEDSND